MSVQKKVKRKVNKKKKFFRIFFRFFIFFTFIFLIIFSLKNSNLFNINSVNIQGAQKVSAKEIIKVSGLEKGNKYFGISKRDRIKKIQSIAYIKNAKIKYKLGGNIDIIVEERSPYYQVESTKYLLVDENFRILEEKDYKTDNLLNLSGLNVENKKGGSYILTYKEDKEKKALLMELKDSKYNLVGNIKSIELLDSLTTFVTLDGIKVEFGSYNNMEYKLRMLSLILEDIKKTDKNATVVQMEKGTNPILIVEENSKIDSSNENEEKNTWKDDKRYIEEKIDEKENSN